MEKRAKRDLFILLLSLIIFSALVLAVHTITFSDGTTSRNIVEDTSTFINVSVNNSDAGQTANITQVNMTLPSGFSATAATNGTDTLADFVISGQVLSWSNFTNYLINGSQIKYFWFNITAANPGNFNITVTTLNASGAFSSNLSFSVNDTTAPSEITFVSPTENSGLNLSRSYVVYNVTATDNGVIDTIIVRLYNSTHNQINSSTSTTSPLYGNFSGLSDGVYYINATVNDTFGYSNSTVDTRSYRLDTTAPSAISYGTGTETNGANLSRSNIVVNVSGTDNGVIDKIVIRLYNSTRNLINTSISSAGAASYTINFTGLNDGVHYFNATVNDTAGNYNDSISTYSVRLDTTAPSSIQFVSPTQTSGLNLSQSYIIYNVTATDNGVIDTIIVRLFNSTHNQVNSSTSATSPLFGNFSGLPAGVYYINATVNDTVGYSNSTTDTRMYRLETTAPVINLISPTNGNTTVPTSVTFSYNVTDSLLTNCSLILNSVIANFNSSVNITGGTNYFTNLSYTVSNTWNVNCTDSAGNTANSSTWSFSLLSSFVINGTVKDENSVALNNSVINITLRDQNGWTVVGYVSGTSNASGWFNFNIASNSSWMYEPLILHRNGSVVDFRSKAIPAFPSSEMVMLAGTTYYLTPAGTINITAVNSSGGRIPFQYQIKDTKLGYPIAEEHTNYATEVNVYVPRNRNYSIMLYPNNSMPVSFNWNNFSSNSSYSFAFGSNYNATTYTLHKQFNTTLSSVRVTGYINATGISGWNNFTVIPFLLEPGNMVHSEYGDMPYNLSSVMYETPQSDIYNLTSGFYNISLPGTAETSGILLFATAINGTNYYGGFRNISLSYGANPVNTNFTMYGLLGDAGNLTLDRIDSAGQIAIPTKKQTFNLVNSTNSTLSQVFAHIETTVDYSSLGAIEFTWMSDIQQTQSSANFVVPLLNSTGIKEMNVYVSGGGGGEEGGQYAPRRISTTTAAQITANNNITVGFFDPRAIDDSVAAGSLTIGLYISNSTCDVPQPPSSCVLGDTNMNDFNPMQAVMGGGKISFRMGKGGGGILIHYVNVDMLASGPPDALFDDETGTSESSSTFQNAMRFGSQGPTIYDYVLISLPYVEGTSSTTGLNENADVNMSIPTFYDDNWNTIWSGSSNGTNASALAGNYSHYSTYQNQWQVLMQQNNCSTTLVLNSTTPCFINKTSNRIWIRLPHFSGAGPQIVGSIITATTTTDTTTTSGGGGSGTPPEWTNTYIEDSEEFSIKASISKSLGEKNRIRIKINNEEHYVGVTDISGTTVTFKYASDPQTVTLNVGQSKKLEVTGDSYYDILLMLNGVNNNKADVTISYIHETIPEEQPPTPAPSEEEESPITGGAVSEEGSTGIIVAIFIALVALAVVIIIIAYSLKNKRKPHIRKSDFY